MTVPSPELEAILVDYGRFMQRTSPEAADRVRAQYRRTLAELQTYAQTQRIQGAIAELKLIPHWRDGVFINDGMAEDSYYFKRLAELNDQENNHE